MRLIMLFYYYFFYIGLFFNIANKKPFILVSANKYPTYSLLAIYFLFYAK